MVSSQPEAPFVVRQIRLEGNAVLVETVVHDRYRRRTADLPWRGYPVRLVLTLRRFCWVNPDCPCSTFAEDYGTSLPRHAWRTREATAYLRTAAYVAGGEAGARLVGGLGLEVSADTLLRLVCQGHQPSVVTPRVLGIDDHGAAGPTPRCW